MKDRTPAFVAVASTALIASTAFAQADVGAQSTTPLTAAVRLNEVTWSQAGSYEWKRPDNVRFIIVRACGGGGGGGGGYSIFPRAAPKQDGGTATGGGGGAGATVSTILLGPLTAPSYTVVIGRGGRGAASSHRTSKVPAGTNGEDGTATDFTGPDLAFETPGAPGGRAGAFNIRMNDTMANVYEEFVTRAGTSGGSYPGGGSAQDGKRGLLGLGGEGNVSGDSGGGGGSLRKGGAGGGANEGGAAGDSCAGGGGAGYLQKEGSSSVGGQGGDGSLMLLLLGI
jgi:hypothetical protein